MWEDAEIISEYSRAQAIEDGVLVDVSTVAKEAGIKFPVAVTNGVWGECVEVPAGIIGQDESGRLWDVLWLLWCAIKATPKGQDTIKFVVHVRKDNKERTPPLVKLWARCGPGDNGEPVITVMLEGED